MNQAIAILGYGYLTSEQLGPHAGVEQSARPGAKLDLSLLERTLRRGLSDVTRLFMHAAKLALDDAGSAPEDVHVVFASAFGEIATAEALLTEAYDADGSSPARFRHSVHNTAAGLFSISNKNYLPCTAVAAGWETVAMALVEASAQLATDAEQVLVVFAEEGVPATLSEQHTHGRLGAAFVLGRVDATNARPVRARLSNLRRMPADQGRPNDFAHPLAPALVLAQAIARGGLSHVVLSDGSMPWSVEVDAQEPTKFGSTP